MSGVAAYPKAAFGSSYAKALFYAAVVFGLSHGVQAVLVSVFKYGASHARLDAFLPLSVFEVIESLIFFVVGLAAVLIPARIADTHIDRSKAEKSNLFLWLGALAGVTYLPLCAGVSTAVLPSVDDPTYLARCLEYMAPMVLAGMTGGYMFGFSRAVSSGR